MFKHAVWGARIPILNWDKADPTKEKSTPAPAPAPAPVYKAPVLTNKVGEIAKSYLANNMEVDSEASDAERWTNKNNEKNEVDK